jgi:hypothetical protein
MATALLTTTLFAMLPEKDWPAWLSLEPIEEPRLIVTAVPAGITMGSRLAS